MATRIDWKLCIICQNVKEKEITRCPADKSNSDAVAVYQSFLDRVTAFRAINKLPHELLLEDVSAELLLENQATWHHSCINRWSNSKLEIAKQRAKTDRSSIESRQSKRKCAEKPHTCLFCNLPNQLIPYETFSAEFKTRRMIAEMNDNDIRERLPNLDFIAAETKYHFSCLTSYRNKYRHFMEHRNNPNEGSIHYQQCKAAAYHELFTFMANELRNGVSEFSRQELKKQCEDSMKNLGYEVLLNKELLSQAILEKFEDFGIQMERGWRNVFVFPEGASEQVELDSARVLQNEVENLMQCTSLIRSEILSVSNSYNGNLTSELSLPRTQNLVSMILYGHDAPISSSNPTLMLTQLLFFNAKSKSSSSTASKLRHNKKREPPIATYLGLKIHFESRSKSLIEKLNHLGLSISYNRILDIEDLQAHNICKQFELEGIVWPRTLQKNSVILGALDNIDHNTSSTTSEGHFHGSGISLMQPAITNEDPRLLSFNAGPFKGPPKLPDDFTIVPAVALNNKKIEARVTTPEWSPQALDSSKAEWDWICNAMPLLEHEVLTKNDTLAWAAYHASLESKIVNSTAVIATLPLFFEKADSPAMVKHAMLLLKKVTDYLNPGQCPVLACDQPIYAQAKFIQWKWPDLFKDFVVMFGGMHIEKAFWNCVGDILESSGWGTMLIQARIAESGTADAFLSVSHICRTRQVHQITALALATLQHQSYLTYVDNSTDLSPSFEVWKNSMLQYPTFRIWNMILEIELSVLACVRSFRLGNFDLYITSLQDLMYLFFALDHQNYSRWLSVHINDILSFDSNSLSLCKANWTLRKTNKRFSNLPLDQIHEQQNAIIKGKGGVVGLTQNPSALKRWMISGPELAQIIDDNEFVTFPSTCDYDDDDTIHYHHSETLAEQSLMQRKTNALIRAIDEYGNPFDENHHDLITLDTRDCTSSAVVESFDTLKSLGHKQYESFLKKVLQSGTESIHNPIKRNSFRLFKAPKKRKVSTTTHNLRNSARLFGRMYLANQHRQGDPLTFFSHENQLDPPSISLEGKMCTGDKSKLLDCIGLVDVENSDAVFDCHIIDGGTLINTLSPAGAVTFMDFANTFVGHLNHLLKSTKRLDLVWDQYYDKSIKSGTRTSRGTGCRRKVAPKTRLPTERAYSWNKFLRNAENKVELIHYLNSVASNTASLQWKWVNFTSDNDVLSIGTARERGKCSLEEADARIFVHMLDALVNGFKRLYIRTVDSDIIYIMIGHFDRFVALEPEVALAVGYGTDKHFCVIDINKMAMSITKEMRTALPVFHSFTGCDTASFFYKKGKTTFWKKLKAFPAVLQAFHEIAVNPFLMIDEDHEVFKLLERFVIIVYDSGSNVHDVNMCRLQMFARKQDLDCSPPTKDALLLHAKRAIYQGGISTTAYDATVQIPSPSDFGWVLVDGDWSPLWMTQDAAAEACRELYRCNCKRRECTNCICKEIMLPCTYLCNCSCQF